MSATISSRPLQQQCSEQQQVEAATALADVSTNRTMFWPQQNQHFSCTYQYDMGHNGAMLDMLAEVASQTLHCEKKLSEIDSKKANSKKNKNQKSQPTNQKSPKIQKVQKNQKSQIKQSSTYTVTQLLSMPATQLVKLFTVFSSDELRKLYSYSCALVPGCGENFTSFASEERANVSIKSHLADHLKFLQNNAETYSTFTATAVNDAMIKVKPTPIRKVEKKVKVQPLKKPLKETLNKENKDIKTTKTANQVRKILPKQVNLKEVENNTEEEKVVEQHEVIIPEVKKEISEIKVLGDHSYFETIRQENIIEEPTTITEVPVNSSSNENIMLMVVETNGVSAKDSSDTIENLPSPMNAEDNQQQVQEDMTLWKDEPVNAKAPDSFMPAKPKGKAKFIGTSKEEREMALILIEKIRKKGNPTGNNLQCRICDPPRSFTAPTTLVSHYRSHAGIKPYECRICKAVFTRRHSLKYHMLIHQNQTRFTCADCGKKFRHPSHFREHRRRHTGEAPFGCEDCGQRFKTRNTYKRHLKTRHGKVLTITGELLHLSEEDSKKVKTKNRRKKQSNIDNIINETATATESIIDSLQNDNYTWEDQQACNSIIDNNVDQCIDNTIWMYEENPVQEENFTEIQDKSPNMKTDINETEIEGNFDSNELVIAQTGSDGMLHFQNYNCAQNRVYADGNTIQFSCEDSICTDMTENVKSFENQGETIVEYQESVDNFNEAIDQPIFTPKEEPVDSLFVLENEEVITETIEDSEMKELISTTESNEEKEATPTETTSEEQTVKIIPCQVKVSDNGGATTLQFLKNSKILGIKGQSINLIQNGKHQTYLLLASNDNNILEFDNSVIGGSKSLPVIPVPAE
ncbi:hypothetical protein TKK_0008280 [Trichogramma kaykai]|uniref:C2H2-type domain-containing protein n=1 Tax=Trichogramma kaykai TaxID=54128 RepID=A0ABD2X4L1_9HYME